MPFIYIVNNILGAHSFTRSCRGEWSRGQNTRLAVSGACFRARRMRPRRKIQRAQRAERLVGRG